MALHIVTVVRVLMLKGTGISPLSSMSVAIAALILGKGVLIADMLPLINRFPESELIVPSHHNAHQNQQAIEEVHRILRLHLQLDQTEAHS